MLEPGVVLSERYRLDDRLGRGAMGDVWRATDLLLGRIVAVKVLLPALIDDPGFSKRFFAEARIMAALHHPGIINVYDYGESRLDGGLNAIYLVMECVDGEPLSAHMAATGRLSVAETLSIVSKVASALQAAHDAEIVHRDVKPGNLLMSREGDIRLADFGVARSGESVALTATNAVLGTARYMAPEQALGRPATAAADIYALGAVAYHCLAGVPPFQGETPIEVALHHVQDDPPPLPEGISPPVREMVSRAMAKDPAERFPTAAAFGAAADALRRDPDSTLSGSAGTVQACSDPAAHASPRPGASLHGSAVAGSSLMHGPDPATGADPAGGASATRVIPGGAGAADLGAVPGGGKAPTIRAAAAVPPASGGGSDDTLAELLAVEDNAGRRRRTAKLAAAGAGLLLALLVTFFFADLDGDRPTGSVTPTAPPTQAPSNMDPTRRGGSGTRTTEPPPATPSRTGPATTAPSTAEPTLPQNTGPVTRTTTPPGTAEATAPPQGDPGMSDQDTDRDPALPWRPAGPDPQRGTQGGPPPIYDPLDNTTP